LEEIIKERRFGQPSTSTDGLSVTDPNEVQPVGGRGDAGRAGFASVQAHRDFFAPHFAERTFHQCAHHQPNHLVQEAITLELDRDAGTFVMDAHRIDCADRAWLGFPAVGGESREVMSSDEMFCCRFENP
jgi:hypothetical protein